jgi:dTDP-glucose 4,6-dehydratase
MSTMLIYGAAGFVGTALGSQLTRSQADRVILVDQRPVPDSVCQRLEENGISVIVRHASALRDLDLPRDIKDVVVLAGQTDVDEALADPHRAFEQNIQIAVEVGEWLRNCPQSKLFYLSSDEVLGESSVPLAENAMYRPTQPYAASKAAAEMVLHCYRDTYSLNVVTIRACNLLGGHQRARKLIPSAVTHLARGLEVPVCGSGRQAREWLAVEDLSSALFTLIECELSVGVYHCSSGVSLTVLQVIQLVARALNTRPRFRHVPDRLVQDRCYAMSCSRLRSLGWLPQWEVGDAIDRAAKAMSSALMAGESLLGAGAPVGGG